MRLGNKSLLDNLLPWLDLVFYWSMFIMSAGEILCLKICQCKLWHSCSEMCVCFAWVQNRMVPLRTYITTHMRSDHIPLCPVHLTLLWYSLPTQNRTYRNLTVHRFIEGRGLTKLDAAIVSTSSTVASLNGANNRFATVPGFIGQMTLLKDMWVRHHHFHACAKSRKVPASTFAH